MNKRVFDVAELGNFPSKDGFAPLTRMGIEAVAAPPMSEKSSRRYAGDLLRSLVKGKPLDLVAERHQEHVANAPEQFRNTGGVVCSIGDMCRALSVSPHSAGGALVGTDVETDIEPTLRALSVVQKAGARYFYGLRASFALPKETSGTTWSWLAAMATITPTDPAYGSIAATPNRCAGAVNLSTQLEAQTNGLAGRFQLESLLAGAVAALDRGALIGSGVMGEPHGLKGTTGVNSITFGGAATLAKVADMIEQCETNNADPDSISFVAHPQVKEKWSSIARLTNGSLSLWNTETGRIEGKPAYVTSNMGTTEIFCGDFTRVLVLAWGADGGLVNFVQDPYTRSLNGEITIVGEMFADIAITRPTLFTIPTDSAVQ
jgi:HK97 family phage major capsid protein